MTSTAPTPTEKTMAGMPAVDSPAPAGSSLAERLAHLLSTSVSAQTVYGTPLTQDGVTVIPVARAMYGFGGGSGIGPSPKRGTGGGGGVRLTPVGFIELRDGRSRFRPIRRSVVPLVVVSGVVALLLLRAVPRLLKNR
ncbi:spore germination protein GerW family protein [Hymenobacter sp. HD11105]